MQVDFNEELHTYHVGGVRYPSVTEIIKPLSNFKGVSESVLEYAAGRGRAVHKACEIYNRGEEFAAPLDPVIVPYFNAWKRFVNEKDVVIMSAEQHLAHPTMRYAGTFDATAAVALDDWLLDIKAVAQLQPCTGVQLAGYANLIGRPAIRRAAVQLKPDGTYLFHEYKSKSDWPTFVSCLTIHNFRSNNNVHD
jgi:hypothetical protein